MRKPLPKSLCRWCLDPRIPLCDLPPFPTPWALNHKHNRKAWMTLNIFQSWQERVIRIPSQSCQWSTTIQVEQGCDGRFLMTEIYSKILTNGRLAMVVHVRSFLLESSLRWSFVRLSTTVTFLPFDLFRSQLVRNPYESARFPLPWKDKTCTIDVWCKYKKCAQPPNFLSHL